MAVITTNDKLYSRSWALLPKITWTCNLCFAQVAQANLGAHTDWHKRHAGFGA